LLPIELAPPSPRHDRASERVETATSERVEIAERRFVKSRALIEASKNLRDPDSDLRRARHPAALPCERERVETARASALTAERASLGFMSRASAL